MTLQTINDLNSLGGDGVLVVALEINIPACEPIFVVRNNEDILYNGNVYIAFPFEIEGLNQTSKDEVPTWAIRVDNTTRALENYILNYDNYIKQNGVNGNYIQCICRVLNTNDLSEPILEEYFELNQPLADSKWITFVLGASSPYSQQFPIKKIYQNFCQWKFKSVECGYVGTLTTCNKTLVDCRERDNSKRFLGFVGVGKGLRLWDFTNILGYHS